MNGVLFSFVIAGVSGTAPAVSFDCRHVIGMGEGLQCSDYNATTPDGFILSLQRVTSTTSSRNASTEKNVVLLWHGLIASSMTFMTNLRNQSLGSILADNGYDVWLANSRGRKPLLHTTLLPNQSKFWEWSWDEMAKYDVPAVVAKALAVTGASTLSYVGHSQGTLIGFVAFSANAALAAKINVMVAMGPVAVLQHSVLHIGNFLDGLMEFMCGVKAPKWTRRNKACDEGVYAAAQAILPTLCKKGDIPGYNFCMEVVCLLAGCESANAYNSTSFPSFVFGHSYFAGSSAQNLNHFAQMLNPLKQIVQAYDYGNDNDNHAHYNSSTPPVYNLSQFGTKVAVFVGQHDKLADPADAARTLALLQPSGGVLFNKTIPNYGHGDFNWALSAAELVFPDVLKVLKEHGAKRD